MEYPFLNLAALPASQLIASLLGTVYLGALGDPTDADAAFMFTPPVPGTDYFVFNTEAGSPIVIRQYGGTPGVSEGYLYYDNSGGSANLVLEAPHNDVANQNYLCLFAQSSVYIGQGFYPSGFWIFGGSQVRYNYGGGEIGGPSTEAMNSVYTGILGMYGSTTPAITCQNASSGAGYPFTITGSNAATASGDNGGNLIQEPGAGDGSGSPGFHSFLAPGGTVSSNDFQVVHAADGGGKHIAVLTGNNANGANACGTITFQTDGTIYVGNVGQGQNAGSIHTNRFITDYGNPLAALTASEGGLYFASGMIIGWTASATSYGPGGYPPDICLYRASPGVIGFGGIGSGTPSSSPGIKIANATSGAGSPFTFIGSSAFPTSNANGGVIRFVPGEHDGSGTDGYFAIQQPGGTAGTNEFQIYHDGTNVQFRNPAGTLSVNSFQFGSGSSQAYVEVYGLLSASLGLAAGSNGLNLENYGLQVQAGGSGLTFNSTNVSTNVALNFTGVGSLAGINVANAASGAGTTFTITGSNAASASGDAGGSIAVQPGAEDGSGGYAYFQILDTNGDPMVFWGESPTNAYPSMWMGNTTPSDNFGSSNAVIVYDAAQNKVIFNDAGLGAIAFGNSGYQKMLINGSSIQYFLPLLISTVPSFNGVNTVGMGLSVIYGLDNRTGLTSADGSPTTLYTSTAANQLYRISAQIDATAFSSGTGTYTFTWTQNSVTKTLVVTSSALNGTNSNTTLIRPDNATAITVQFTITGIGTYTVAGLVEELA